MTNGVYSDGMQRIDLGGSQIEYLDRGQGEPVVLVHAGLFSDWFAPVSETQALGACRVVHVRRAGYGTNVSQGHLSISDHARHIGALADRLSINKLHYVGHSSSCLMGLQLALERPELIQSLILLEPAGGGGLTVPASEDIGRTFIGPAMAAFGAGDIETAFDTFMRGVCGERHRAVIEARLGSDGYRRAIRDARFFFGDEITAVLEWHFGADQATRVQQPILVVEGADSNAQGPLFHQVTERVRTLLPHAEVTVLDGVNHLMPLQDPETIGRIVAAFVQRYPVLH
jgi:pimeloyl-ACP methyl ester carboxylesterase